MKQDQDIIYYVCIMYRVGSSQVPSIFSTLDFIRKLLRRKLIIVLGWGNKMVETLFILSGMYKVWRGFKFHERCLNTFHIGEGSFRFIGMQTNLKLNLNITSSIGNGNGNGKFNMAGGGGGQGIKQGIKQGNKQGNAKSRNLTSPVQQSGIYFQANQLWLKTPVEYLNQKND